MGRTSGTSIRSCTLTVSAARSPDSAARQHGQRSGRCSTTSSGVSLITRLWPSCPGLAPPGFERSRCSLRSVEGGLAEVREVFSGRCRRSTSSINSSLLRRSSSPRPIPPLNQQKRPASRAWVNAIEQLRDVLAGAQRDRHLLVYVDEAHIHQDADLGYGWAERGQRLWVASSS